MTKAFRGLPAPVSYTHLDVYKRQAFGCPNLKATVERLRMVAALAPDPVAKKLFYMLSVKLSAEGVERWYRCFYCKLRALQKELAGRLRPLSLIHI